MVPKHHNGPTQMGMRPVYGLLDLNEYADVWKIDKTHTVEKVNKKTRDTISSDFVKTDDLIDNELQAEMMNWNKSTSEVIGVQIYIGHQLPALYQ